MYYSGKHEPCLQFEIREPKHKHNVPVSGGLDSTGLDRADPVGYAVFCHTWAPLAKFQYLFGCYTTFKCANLVSTEPSVSFLIPSLKVCTTLSTNPFDTYWVIVMCLIPFFFKNCLNSSLVNVVALSETTTSGRPRDANKILIVTAEVDVGVHILPATRNVHQSVRVVLHSLCESWTTVCLPQPWPWVGLYYWLVWHITQVLHLSQATIHALSQSSSSWLYQGEPHATFSAHPSFPWVAQLHTSPK